MDYAIKTLEFDKLKTESDMAFYIKHQKGMGFKVDKEVIKKGKDNIAQLQKAISTLKAMAGSEVIMEGVAKDGYIQGYNNHDEELLFGVHGELEKLDGKKIKLILMKGGE